jgi:hypothetical protein
MLATQVACRINDDSNATKPSWSFAIFFALASFILRAIYGQKNKKL